MNNNSNVDVTGGAVKEVLKSEQVKELTLPFAKRVGIFFDDVFSLVFANWTHELAEKSRLKHKKNIESFKKKLNEDLTQIPEKERVFPKESIVGPALEASKYYFEETEIRDMFEKLIVSSMDSRKASQVLPCFTEIIKQMTPLDAKNLFLFNKKIIIPIAEYQIVNPDGTYTVAQTNVFLENHEYLDLELQSVSLAALQRLGLIEIDYDRYISIESVYDVFKHTQEYIDLTEKVNMSNLRNGKKKKASIQKGEAILTPLGKAFIKVCLS